MGNGIKPAIEHHSGAYTDGISHSGAFQVKVLLAG